MNKKTKSVMTVQYEYFFKLLISAFFFIFSTMFEPSNNKLFKEISNNWEIRITLSISGVVLFVYQFEIVLLLTNSLSARSSWVNPIDFLLVCNTSPKFI